MIRVRAWSAPMTRGPRYATVQGKATGPWLAKNCGMPAETLKRILPFVLFGAAVALVLMAAACADDAPAPPGERNLAVWSEFMSDTEMEQRP